MIDLAAQLDLALSELEIAKRTIRQYNDEFLKLREEHATAVFAAQESARALRDLTRDMLLKQGMTKL